MNWDDLDKWCTKKGYDPINPTSIAETGVIKAYRLVFNHYSSSRGGGALNIVRSPAHEVCGVLFALSEEDFKKIIEKEGSKYKPHSVNVILNDGKVVGAKTFKAENNRDLYPPTTDYLEIVFAGAVHFNLGKKCLEKIKKAAQQAKNQE